MSILSLVLGWGLSIDAEYIIFYKFLPNDSNFVHILLFTKQQVFRLVQIESICRQQNVTQNLKFVLGREENIVGKGENPGYQHFLLFSQCF